MRRRLLVAAAVLAVAFGLAGCNVASHVVVQPDGSGTYSVIMTVPNGSSNAGAVLYRAVRSGAAHDAVPLQVTPYSAGNEGGAKTSFNFQSLADLNAESKRLSASGNGIIGVTLVRNDSGWHFTATSAKGLTTPPGGTPTGVGTGGIINSASLDALIQISVVVQLPGIPGESNANTVTHTATTSTFSWVLAAGKTATGLQASTSFVGDQASVKLASALTHVASVGTTTGSGGSGAGSSAWIYILIGVAVVAGGGTLVLVRRRRPNIATE